MNEEGKADDDPLVTIKWMMENGARRQMAPTTVTHLAVGEWVDGWLDGGYPLRVFGETWYRYKKELDSPPTIKQCREWLNLNKKS